jgi:hypothetical protein
MLIDGYKAYSDDDIPGIVNTIAQYGKTLGVVSTEADLRPQHQALFDALEAAGVQVDTKAYLMEPSMRMHDCSIFVDPDCGGAWEAWQTTFMLPSLDDFRTYAKMEDDPGRLSIRQIHGETWWWSTKNKRWFEQYDPTSYTKGLFLDPMVGDGPKQFRECILHIHPELEQVYDQIYPVYAGANSSIAIDKVPFLELVSRLENAFKMGYKKIFFVNSDETLQQQSVFKCHRLVRWFSDKPADTWFHVTGCLDGVESYDRLCKFYNTEPIMHIISGYRFENVVLDSTQFWTPNGILDPFITDIEYKIEPKAKKFVCFNRVPRWHRIRLLAFMFEKGLVDQGYYSFELSLDSDAGLYSEKRMWNVETTDQQFCGRYMVEPYIENIYKNWEQLPLTLNRTKDRFNPVDLNPEDVPYHTDSYFSIVCETNFFHSLGKDIKPISLSHTDGVFISEKMYKPIAYKHPFVTLAMPKTLEYLRKVGYKTFHPYIDESYDQLVNDEERFAAVTAEIERLCNLSTDEWLQLMENLKPIVEHNQKWLGTRKPLNSTPYDVLQYFER